MGEYTYTIDFTLLQDLVVTVCLLALLIGWLMDRRRRKRVQIRSGDEAAGAVTGSRQGERYAGVRLCGTEPCGNGRIAWDVEVRNPKGYAEVRR